MEPHGRLREAHIRTRALSSQGCDRGSYIISTKSQCVGTPGPGTEKEFPCQEWALKAMVHSGWMVMEAGVCGVEVGTAQG